MNHRSHYQDDFFEALSENPTIDLCVRYFAGDEKTRLEEGWNSATHLKTFEKVVDSAKDLGQLLGDVPDYQERIHVISRTFSPSLVDHLCKHKLPWVHWSEIPGISLSRILGYRVWLYKLLIPLMFLWKKQELSQIRNDALGVFVQGKLARDFFRRSGIDDNSIADLYYSPKSLTPLEPDAKVISFANKRRVFLYVGALDKRKGTDLLIRAFSKIQNESWCLVLCGIDRSNGVYTAMVNKLKLSSKILFLGSFAHNQVASIYCASDVVVLPSRFDGWGVVLNEAASLAKPLIGSSMCGASWHLIEDNHNGFRVEADSVEDLYKAMRTYVNQPDLISVHGENSKILFFKRHTPEKNVERCIEALTNRFAVCE